MCIYIYIYTNMQQTIGTIVEFVLTDVLRGTIELALIGYHPVHQSSLAKLFGPQVSSSISKKWRNPSWIFELGDLEIGKKQKHTKKHPLKCAPNHAEPVFHFFKTKKTQHLVIFGLAVGTINFGCHCRGFSLENLPAKAGHDHGILLPRVSEVPHHPVDDTSKSHVFFPIDITL